MDIAGKVGLVTGGAGGIGRAMIEILLQKDAKCVYLVDNNESASQKVLKELQEKYGEERIRFYKCNVTSHEELEACFKEAKSLTGELHIVCNNAGIMNEIDWQLMLDINVKGVISGTKLGLQYMDGDSNGGAVIINTASVAGLAIVPFALVYSTSKYAVIGFSRGVATFDPEALKKNIRVNVLCPPVVDTPLIVHRSPTGLVPDVRYEDGLEEIFNLYEPMQPSVLAKHFVKLIEEPHNGQTMYVDSAVKSELIEDNLKTFRETHGGDGPYNEIVKKVVDQL